MVRCNVHAEERGERSCGGALAGVVRRRCGRVRGRHNSAACAQGVLEGQYVRRRAAPTTTAAEMDHHRCPFTTAILSRSCFVRREVCRAPARVWCVGLALSARVSSEF